MTIDPNALINEEIRKRDAAPPFVMSLSHDELVVRHQELERLNQRLMLLFNHYIDQAHLMSPSFAIDMRRGLERVVK